MKAATRLLCSLGLFLGSMFDAQAAITGTVKTIGGSFTAGYVDGNNTVSLFNQPSGMALDSNGRLLVADFNNNVVRFITIQDEITGTFATGNLSGPISIAVAPNGEVFVVNFTAGNIVRFNRTGTFLGTFVAGLANPTAIVMDASGHVFVAIQAGVVRRYNAAGAFLQSYTVTEGAPEFRGLALTGDGSIAVSDAGNHVIWKFGMAGGSPFLTAGTLGSPGFAEGASGFARLNSPQQIATGPGGVLIVADRGNHRIRAVDPSGLLSTLYGVDPAVWEDLTPEQLPGWADGAAAEAELRDPVGLTVDSSGNVYDSEVFYSVIRRASSLSFPTNSLGGGGGVSTTPSGSTQNRISLGFASGEASSDFVASPGQRFTAPVTLSLIPGTKIYGMQFNLTITNVDAVTPSAVYDPKFTSMLMKPRVDNPGILERIDPKLFVRMDKVVVPTPVQIGDQTITVLVTNFIPAFSNLVVTNLVGNFIGVGWLERKSSIGTNLYNTIAQDLIKFSQPHDYTFDGALGRVVVGAVTFVVPKTATVGNKYLVRIGRPSANSDGVAQDVFIEAPDGSDASVPIAAVRTLNIESRRYLVGDVVPFRWFNAGDFGDNNILNNDLLQLQEAFQETPTTEHAYGFNIPPVGSDMFDALDSCCISTNLLDNYSDPTKFQTADANIINKIGYGDGFLTLEDLYVTFRRSLDPSLVNYVRYFKNGERFAEVTTNSFRGTAADGPIKLKKPAYDQARAEESVSARFTAGHVKGSPGQTAHVPVDLEITGPLSARSILLRVSVISIDDTPGLSTPIAFTPTSGVGYPTSSAVNASSYTGVWFELANSLAAGSHRVGTIDFSIPATANADTLYSVRIERAEASAALTRFPVTTSDAIVLMENRATEPWNDEIPDAWRVQYFGSLMNVLSAPEADADGDGATTLEEYRAGTNPNDVGSRLALDASGAATGVSLKWPTATGKYYRLESSPSLTGAIWTTVEDRIPGTGGIIQRAQAPDGAATRFFRVQIE